MKRLLSAPLEQSGRTVHTSLNLHDNGHYTVIPSLTQATGCLLSSLLPNREYPLLLQQVSLTLPTGFT